MDAYANQCYKYVESESNFYDAQSACNAMGSYLVEIHDTNEHEAVDQYLTGIM